MSIKPLIVTFDDDVDETDFSPIEPIDDIVVHPTQVIPEDEHEGNELFSVPLALWQEGWPDPAESLGIGTGDPLVDYPKGYATCFARR